MMIRPSDPAASPGTFSDILSGKLPGTKAVIDLFDPLDLLPSNH